MTLFEFFIVFLICLGIFTSLTGKPEFIIELWQNYFINKKHYIKVEILIMLIMLLTIIITITSKI